MLQLLNSVTLVGNSIMWVHIEIIWIVKDESPSIPSSDILKFPFKMIGSTPLDWANNWKRNRVLTWYCCWCCINHVSVTCSIRWWDPLLLNYNLGIYALKEWKIENHLKPSRLSLYGFHGGIPSMPRSSSGRGSGFSPDDLMGQLELSPNPPTPIRQSRYTLGNELIFLGNSEDSWKWSLCTFHYKVS